MVVMYYYVMHSSSKINFKCTAFPVPRVTMTYTEAFSFAVRFELTASPVTIRDSVAGCSTSAEIKSPAGPEWVALPTS